MGSRKTVTMPRMEKPLYKLSDNRTDCGMRTCENNVIKKWWFLKALFTSDKLFGEKRQEKGENWKWNTWILCSPEPVMMKHNVILIIYHVFHQYFTEWRFLFSMSRKFYYYSPWQQKGLSYILSSLHRSTLPSRSRACSWDTPPGCIHSRTYQLCLWRDELHIKTWWSTNG